MPIEADFVFDVVEGRTYFSQDVTHIGFDGGTPAVKHGAFLVVNDLYLQTVGRCRQFDLGAEFGQFGAVGNHGAYFCAQYGQFFCVLLGSVRFQLFSGHFFCMCICPITAL